MNYYVMTLFPEMIDSTLSHSITGRALEKGQIQLNSVDIRDYAQNKSRHVDDYIYGGGSGMLMQIEPVWLCYKDIMSGLPKENTRVLYMSPQGKTFNQEMAKELSQSENLVFLCGHYEGIDERAIELINPEMVSIGDFVLTGGELPAIMMIDAITRLIPGVLGSDDSAIYETFYEDLLECPQYTRPPEYEGLKVPEILLSGNHKLIEEWRREQAIKRTKELRSDMYQRFLTHNNIYDKIDDVVNDKNER
ncbi:MAG: tRNA (guanosine(37)-N1)-methyltransferase TrmD [Eubacterium sp.]|nr:tRNA (guanosine(37)-N1)-methyltransferase TrmD [Eubacterium sp.]